MNGCRDLVIIDRKPINDAFTLETRRSPALAENRTRCANAVTAVVNCKRLLDYNGRFT